MAVHAQDPVTITVGSTLVALIAQDPIGGIDSAPVLSNESPAAGSINQHPDVAIYFELD